MMTARVSLLAAFLVCACAHAEDAPKNTASTSRGEVKDLPDFDGVAVSSGIKAEVKVGPKSVRLEGDPESVARVHLKVEDGMLTTEVDRNGSFFSRGLRGKVHLYVTNPKVTRLEASGGCTMNAEATATDSFSVEASGGSDITVRGVDARELEAEASGGATVTVSGRAKKLEAEASGGSEVHARELRGVDELHADASGGARVEVDTARSVSGEASGGSIIQLTSRPEHSNVDTSGGSKVVY